MVGVLEVPLLGGGQEEKEALLVDYIYRHFLLT